MAAGNILLAFKATTNTIVRVLPIGLYLGTLFVGLGFGDEKASLLFVGLILNDLISFGYKQALKPVRNERCAILKSGNDFSLMISPHTQVIGFTYSFILRHLYYTDDYFPYKAFIFTLILFATIWSRADVGCMTVADGLYTSLIGIFIGILYYEIVKSHMLKGYDLESIKEETPEDDFFNS